MMVILFWVLSVKIFKYIIFIVLNDGNNKKYDGNLQHYIRNIATLVIKVIFYILYIPNLFWFIHFFHIIK